MNSSTAPSLSFFALSGMQQDDDLNSTSYSVFASSLPAIFGRETSTGTPTPPSISLGTHKLLSRQHIEIDQNDDCSWRITCLSKNFIVVDGVQINQSESTTLRHRSPIKIANCYLYFLLPEDTAANCSTSKSPPTSPKKKAISISTPTSPAPSSPAKKKQKTEKKEEPITLQTTNVTVAEINELSMTKIIRLAAIDSGQANELRALAEENVVVWGTEDATMAAVKRSDIVNYVRGSVKYGTWWANICATSELEEGKKEKGLEKALSKSLGDVGFVRMKANGLWGLPEVLED